MAEHKLENPLTQEERLQVPRLIGHDSMGNLSVLLCSLDVDEHLDRKALRARALHIGTMESAIHTLTQESSKNLSSIIGVDKLDRHHWEHYDQMLSTVFEERVRITRGNVKTFLTDIEVLYCALQNLVKNAVTDPFGKPVRDAQLHVDFHEGFPQKTVYIPDGARDYKNFVAFSVRDQGQGFSPGVPLESYFSGKTPKKASRGFGLYFVTLVSKFLRAPINITSQPGNTEVIFYHPIYSQEFWDQQP